MKYLYVLLAAGLFMLSGCQQTPPKIADQPVVTASESPAMDIGTFKYSFTIPKGWTRVDTMIHSKRSSFLFPPFNLESIFTSNINISSDHMRGMSLDAYAEKHIDLEGRSRKDEGLIAQTRVMQNIVAGTVSTKVINGNTVRVQKYKYTVYGKDMNGILAVIPKDGIAYFIMVTTPKGRPDYHKEFDIIVNSFSISTK